MKKKVRLTALAAAGILASLSVSTAGIAYGAPATRAQALDTAAGYVPSDSTHQSTQEDSCKYEVKFYNDSRKEKYEVEVSKSTGSLISFESDRYDSRGSGVVKLSEEEAKKPVIGEIPDAKILSVTLDYDDGKEYDVRFCTDSYYGTYAIHGENGTILERDIRVGSQGGTHDVPESLDEGQAISRERVTQLAQEKVPGGVITDIDLDWEGGRLLYEVELYKDSTEYDLAYDANSGDLLWSSQETEWWDDDRDGGYRQNNASSQAGDTSRYIGMEKARSLALARVPGATVYELELDHDDGRTVYEGSLRKGRWEYEFTIDAVTGEFWEWEEED